MKTKLNVKRALALGLALLMTASLSAAPASASEALGSALMENSVELATGASVTGSSFWSASKSDLRTEHYVTYTPNDQVTPMLWYGDMTDDKVKLTAGAERLAEQGLRVVAGINGGFFNTDGSPVGLLFTDGHVRSLDRENYCMVGFGRDGSAFFDTSPITKTVSWTDGEGQPVELELAALNASRQNGLLYLYNDDYGFSTKNKYEGVDVVLFPQQPGEKPTLNCRLALTVAYTIDSTREDVEADNYIAEGYYVLSANKKCSDELLNALRGLRPGTEVTVEISGGDPRWEDAACGLTALYRLVEDGECVTDWLGTGAAPRTAIGLREDGSVIFYTIDGRLTGYSIGASYTQIAQRLMELGCVQAAALDGGGSTTLGGTLPGDEEFQVLNRPSGGSQRAVNNSLFLVTAVPAGEAAERLYAAAENDVVLSGSSTAVTVAAADANGWPQPVTEALELTSDGGTVSVDEEGNFIFTAGDEEGVFTLSAADGELTGSAPVRVVQKLTSFKITRRDTGVKASNVVLLPGEELELDATGRWWNLPVAMTDADVTWTVDGDVGEIDENGRFTASLTEGKGTVTAAAGEKTVTIKMTVKRNDPFTDLEGHWSRPYVLDLYDLGLINGIEQEDGTFQYQPDKEVTRGEVLIYITRLLGIDTALYEDVELPFADLDQVQGWQLPGLKAMFELGVFQGCLNDELLTARMGDPLTREEILTLLGRLVEEQLEYNLDEIPDNEFIHPWCVSAIQTLAAYGVVDTAEELRPLEKVTRGEMASIVTPVSRLPLIHPEPPAPPEEERPDDPEGETPAGPEELPFDLEGEQPVDPEIGLPLDQGGEAPAEPNGEPPADPAGEPPAEPAE